MIFWIALVSFHSELCKLFNWLAVSLWFLTIYVVTTDHLHRFRTTRYITFTKDNYFHALTVSFCEKKILFFLCWGTLFLESQYYLIGQYNYRHGCKRLFSFWTNTLVLKNLKITCSAIFHIFSCFEQGRWLWLFQSWALLFWYSYMPRNLREGFKTKNKKLVEIFH